MAQLVHLKPGPGEEPGTVRRVRDPRRGMAVMPPDGYPMPLDAWARRRLACRDLVRVRPARPAVAEKPAKNRKEG